MAKKNENLFENSVNHREILNFAILYMIKKVEEQIDICNGDKEMAKRHFGMYFAKLRLLCNAYEIETGEQYELGAVCGLEYADLN